MCFTLYTLPLWCCESWKLTTDNTKTLIPQLPCHPPTTVCIFPKYYSSDNVIWHICIFFFITTTSTPVAWVLTPPPPQTFLSHPVLLVFCCDLVKSQLATVSRSLAALTMASGIMLNTAPRLLSPSTGVSDALWSTQERDGGLSMKMSLQLHKRISQTPSLSALPPLASPFPTLKISFRQSFEVQPHLLQLFHNACPFWICMNSLSRCFCCHLDLQWCVLYSVGYCIIVEWKE